MENKFIILTIIVLIVLYCIYRAYNRVSDKDIIKATDNWIHAVTVNHDPKEISSLFCHDASLIGTVSQKKRRGYDIKKYFYYFSKLPGIKVLDKEYNVSKVTNGVFVNTAFITWFWKGLTKPVTARMTFVFRGTCIYQLHSSVLPELNQALLDVSGKE
jgi:hypothetical protein